MCTYTHVLAGISHGHMDPQKLNPPWNMLQSTYMCMYMCVCTCENWTPQKFPAIWCIIVMSYSIDNNYRLQYVVYLTPMQSIKKRRQSFVYFQHKIWSSLRP